jgi:hypothetical protein
VIKKMLRNTVFVRRSGQKDAGGAAKEAENWDPEHDDQDENDPEIEYSDNKGDTVVCELFVSPAYLLTSGKVYFS